MAIIFGPVASRRFGSSLGIDLSPEQKCCNFDCLYCELAPAKVRGNIANPPSVAQVITELKKAISTHGATDVITLTANGEPTLYPYLEELITQINAIKSTQKVLILSNGSGAMDKGILESLKELDIVKFSLDSADPLTYRKIDRTLAKPDLSTLIANMSQFAREFKGELVMEVLVLEGLNDSEREFELLNTAFGKIKPARVDISTLDRPPAYPNAKAISEERLRELAALITAAPVFVATRKAPASIKELNKSEILKLLALRPQSVADVESGFCESSKEILKSLLNSGQVAIHTCAGVEFYKLK